MATVVAVIGGYITYGLARKGGKEAFERAVQQEGCESLRTIRARGFWAVAVPAMLPPPFPIVPFLLAAGAMQYSRQKFVSALALGRGIRFMVVAGPGSDLWAAHHQVLLAILQASTVYANWAGGDCRNFFPVSVLPLQEPDSDGLDNYDHTRSVASLCGATNTLFDLSSL